MVNRHIVWDVDKAKPMSDPLIYATAAQHAEALEKRFQRAFTVLPCMIATPSNRQRNAT